MATAIEKARANAARGAPAPSNISIAARTKAADWKRDEEDRLLLAFQEGKTGQALADAMGGGRNQGECERKLKKLMPTEKTTLLAYGWDEKTPRKHTEKIRKLLLAEEQNLSKPALTW